MNDIKSVFIDNDKPELIFDVTESTCECHHKPDHHHCHPYERKNNIINRPYSDQPIPVKTCKCHDEIIPNTVPNTYLSPQSDCECHHHPDHHHHHHDGCGCEYVTRRELNHVLTKIAEADIFRDISTDGTTVTVGGIKKGTKLEKLTFAQFIDMLLYPEDVPPQPSGESEINDDVIATDSTWSSNKINSIFDGSVKYNEAQELTDEQKKQARDNIGVGEAVDGIQYKIVKEETPEEDCVASYNLYKSVNGEEYEKDTESASINIPKNSIIKSASVKTCTTEDEPVEGYKVGDKYIDFVIASDEDEHIYILLSDIIKPIDIDDSTVSYDTTWSSNKIQEELNAIKDYTISKEEIEEMFKNI